MFTSKLTVPAFVGGLCVVVSCAPSTGGTADRCREGRHVFDVEYHGDVRADGTFVLVGAAGGRATVELTLGGDSDASAGTRLHTTGEGSCVNGVARVRLHPSTASDSTQLLSGTLVVLLDAEPFEQAFGRWSAEIVAPTKADRAKQAVRGFLVAKEQP